MGKIISLDWNKDLLFGWETEKSDRVILSIIRGIELRDDFPPVPIIGDDGEYYISDFRKKPESDYYDGGHNRAVAHYIMSEPLKCELVRRGRPTGEQSNRIDIREIKIFDDRGEYSQRRKGDPRYRLV